VRRNDGTLYTGITKNLDKRVEEHNSKPVVRNTPGPGNQCGYFEQAESRSSAAKKGMDGKKNAAGEEG